ncbi:MAG: phenylalanine--tRNA ligase beta subunit-related protein [Patescibacteria group bacterium]
MKVSYRWLQDYIDAPLPSAEKVAEALTMHAFEVETVEEVGDDFVLDVDVLPNRTHDCLSHMGIAREVALLLDLPFKPPVFDFKGDPSVRTDCAIALSVPAEKFVRRAVKRVVFDVKVGPSPEWLKVKLETLGQRSINNIVDATNFVMLETGQPVHAFDYDKIADGSPPSSPEPCNIVIRLAKEGETITTLDTKTYTLNPSNLVIADSEKALDIAGVKGGANSAIDENTTRVLLSACTFHPTSVRKTSRTLNLLTDASKRFEQEVSPALAEKAMHRLSEIVAQVAGGKVAGDIIDFYPRKRNPYVIGVATDEVNKLLGSKMSDKDVETILTRLGFEWKQVNPVDEVLRLAPTLVGKPYKYGASISYDAPNHFDCSSFISYLFAHAGVAVPRVTVDQYIFGDEISENDLQPGDIVFARNNTTGEEKEVEIIATGEKVVQKVEHTETRDFMKGTKLPVGLDHNGIYLGDGKIIQASGMWHKGSVVIEDLKETPSFKNVRGYRRFSDNTPRYVVTVPFERLDLHAGPGFMISGNMADLIEEIGRVYGYDKITPQELPPAPAPVLNKTFYYTNKVRDILVDVGFSEVMTYAFQEKGQVELANPLAEDKKYLCQSLGAGLSKAFEENSRNAPLVGSPVQIFEIGTIFSPEEHIELGIMTDDKKVMSETLAILEKEIPGFTAKQTEKGIYADLSGLIEKLPDSTEKDLPAIGAKGKTFTPISAFPFILRDIAVWVPALVSSEDVQKLITSNAGGWLVRIDQFDEYKKEDKTSYAFHLVFQSNKKTLTDDEINGAMKNVEEKMKGEGWTVR